MNNFITNSNDKYLKNRLQRLINGSKELKFLVGFFYFSGWQEIYKTLKKNDDVCLKILVGLQVDKYLLNIIETEHEESNLSNEEYFTNFMKSLGYAINNADMDNKEFYEQIEFFIRMLEDERLIIRKTLDPNHAKLYIFHLKEENQWVNDNVGQFITGSSNLTKAGLHKQNEFNVEIRDYGFEDANKYFDNLWDDAVPITEAVNGKKTIVDFLKNKSQSSLVTPFEAYAYILKTYIDLHKTTRKSHALSRLLKKAGFKEYSYQVDAVNQAITTIDTYNGVIIADVVGLGKSVIASLVAHQLHKRGLIICPPGLIGDKYENSGWWEYINKFELFDWDIESTGKMEELAESLVKDDRGYEVVIIDEAHRFRNQDTEAYESLANICRSKKVILLTATPFNNSPGDIFSMLKLFIVPGKSAITIESDIEGRFNSYNYRFKIISYIMKNHNSKKKDNRDKAKSLYIKLYGLKPPIDLSLVKKDVKRMATDIKAIISPIVIRRNRIDLKEDFQYKKEVTTLSKLTDPKEIFYELSPKQSVFYDKIINDYFGEDGLFTGAIYRPHLYEKADKKKKGENGEQVKQQQKNLFDFMRRLLVKRFESSFGAFSKSIERFLKTHEFVLSFIKESGFYFLDRALIESIYNSSENEPDFIPKDIKNILEQFKKNSRTKISPKHTKVYYIKDLDYEDKFIEDIESDIELFKKVKKKIEELDLVANDPKREKVLSIIRETLIVEKKPVRKVIIFSEYTDTVEHLKEYFVKNLQNRVLTCSGAVNSKFAEELNENFNAMNKKQVNDYDVLITSDKLSEGFNLNRAGMIINYDIPWNPTRVIQRLGRINRIGLKVFDELHISNIFPTEKGADEVKTRQIAEHKMFLIHNALGEDSKIFNPDEEPTASGLFKKMNTNPEKEDELSIDTIIRNAYENICNNYPGIINKINELPNRTKTSKPFDSNNTIVFRRKGLALFCLKISDCKGDSELDEMNFQDIHKYVECEFNTKRQSLSDTFWTCYEKAKTFKPQYRSGSSSMSIENRAINSLKSLLRQRRNELDQKLISFIDTLLLDLKRYKTLSKQTVRKLVLPKVVEDNDYITLINAIIELRQRIGTDYLDVILARTSNIHDDVIIAVENRMK